MNVKEGDEVLLRQGNTSRIQRVKKVTPTGQITIKNGLRFNSGGDPIGHDVGFLRPVKGKDGEDLLRSIQLDDLRTIRWDTLSDEVLNAVARVLFTYGIEKVAVRLEEPYE